MAVVRRGTYSIGQDKIECRIKRVASQNTRIVLDDETEKLVPSECVSIDIVENRMDAPERLIPTIPLEKFYRPLRDLEGSKQDQFQSLLDALHDRHGPKDAVFLAELFQQSVRHAERYANIDEEFYPDRTARSPAKSHFANNFVRNIANQYSIHVGNHELKFVDYEIYPFRTTKSCGENGEPATRMGSGGMDLLLASGNENILPAIGEVKAKTETVGPTFALVQSLMYAAQMVTRNQFLRLKKHYADQFSEVSEKTPRVDLIVFLEHDQKQYMRDLEFAMPLAVEVGKLCSKYLRSILFVSCSLVHKEIHCDVIEPVMTD